MNTALKTIVGTVAAGILTAYVPKFEGMILRGYKDPIGIVTACAGHTKTAVLGRSYSREECVYLLEADLAEHAIGVKSCVHSEMTPWQLASFVSLAYNVGVRRFCNSTMAQLANASDFDAACAEFGKWVYAGGRVWPGLVSRRATEAAICRGEIGAMKDATQHSTDAGSVTAP